MYDWYGQDFKRGNAANGHICACLRCWNSIISSVSLHSGWYVLDIDIEFWSISDWYQHRGPFYKSLAGVFPHQWVYRKWTIIGVTLPMQICWKYSDNTTSLVTDSVVNHTGGIIVIYWYGSYNSHFMIIHWSVWWYHTWRPNDVTCDVTTICQISVNWFQYGFAWTS